MFDPLIALFWCLLNRYLSSALFVGHLILMQILLVLLFKTRTFLPSPFHHDIERNSIPCEKSSYYFLSSSLFRAVNFQATAVTNLLLISKNLVWLNPPCLYFPKIIPFNNLSLTLVSSFSFTWFHPIGIQYYGPLAFEVFICLYMYFGSSFTDLSFNYSARPFSTQWFLSGAVHWVDPLSPLQACCFAWKGFSSGFMAVISCFSSVSMGFQFKPPILPGIHALLIGIIWVFLIKT